MAASPADSLEGQVQPSQEQITFRFCRECSNMLYPKEDRNSNKLMFACRTCQFSEEAISSCVFRNNLYNTVGETAGVTQDVGSDPTVGIPYFCTLCGQEIECSYYGETNDDFCDEMDDDSLMEMDATEDGTPMEELDSELDSKADQQPEQNHPKVFLGKEKLGGGKINT